MTAIIKTGDILVEGLTHLPPAALFESEPYAHGWKLVKNLDGNRLNQIIRGAGWNFFYIAGELNAGVFGSDEEKTIRQAIRKMFAKTTAKKFNCLEITRMVRKRFLGLPYLSISAHSRHIQKSIILFQTTD